MGELANVLISGEQFEHRGLPRSPRGVHDPAPVRLHKLSAFTHSDSLLLSLPSCRPVMEVPSDKPLPEEQARLYLRDIILGLEYCESGLGGAACGLEQGTGGGHQKGWSPD